MLFKCPVCQERHSVREYDAKDYICSNGSGRRSRKTFQGLTPEDLLTRSNPGFNRASTKVNEARAATILIAGPDFKDNGERRGTLKKNW